MIQPDKAQHALQLVDILLRRFQTDIGGRAAEFLLDLVQNKVPGPLPPLPWFTRGNRDDFDIEIREPAALRISGGAAASSAIESLDLSCHVM